MTWQFARFLVVGVVNTIVGLGIIFAAKAFLNLGDVAANASGYAVGLTVSFFLNKSWTFAHRGDLIASAFRFLGIFCIAYFFNLATVLILINWAAANTYLAQALGVPCYTIVFFYLSKHFAFRNSVGHGDQPNSANSPQHAGTVGKGAEMRPPRDARGL